jgi:hypothetical protein
LLPTTPRKIKTFEPLDKRRIVMSIGITWITLEEAASKYCLAEALIQQWVGEGVIRAEQEDTRQMRINLDDLELKVQERTGI